MFSRAEVPLIHESVELLDSLEHALKLVITAPVDLDSGMESSQEVIEMNHPIRHPIIRVAAQASLTVVRKYEQFTEDCEVYWLAIGELIAFSFQSMLTNILSYVALCPDRKLQWFRDRGWSEQELSHIRRLLSIRFNESYQSMPSVHAVNESQNIPVSISSHLVYSSYR